MPEFISREIGNTPLGVEDPFEDQEFQEFSCPPNTEDIALDLQNPEAVNSRAHRLFDPSLVAGWNVGDPLPTPDAVIPHVTFDRQGLRDTDLIVPGLNEPIEVWSFRDRDFDEDDGVGTERTVWPAHTIRVKEGQIVHTNMNSRRDMHTIHHHGIEPTPANDGVGHLTFDVQHSHYNYQWLAAESGTYFYHCHVNTTMHFELGMYGMLIIDPPHEGPDYRDGGPGTVYRESDIVPYQKEAIWVADDIDRRWHAEADHGHQGDSGVFCDHFVTIDSDHNPRLHDFNPDVFVVSGVPAAWNPALNRTEPNALVVLDPQGQGSVVTPRVTVGEKLLIRALNASYTTTRWKFASSIHGEVIAADGRTLGHAPPGHHPFGQYSSPFTLASVGNELELTTAQRRDILVDSTDMSVGTHDVEIGYYHWITNNLIQRIRVRIIVEA